MDSLTQLTLGAAVGEAVAGKKLGNKAMLWGALAGTIPDLDVITNFWMDDIEAMAFHRGISHSILFSLVVPIILAAFTSWLYRKNPHENKVYKKFWQKIWIIIGVLIIALSGYVLFSSFNIFTAQVFIMFGGLGGYWIWRSFNQPNDDFEEISFRHWYLFFFLGFATHIMIDAFTTYGTQIFQPFHNHRFTTSSISVVDPLYTVPFLICLILSSFFKRKDKRRTRWNNAGLIISSLYMLLTFANKANINTLFADRMEALHVTPIQKMTNPTIFNNILWHGIAEIDTAYIESYYSLFDKKEPFSEIRIIPKNRTIVEKIGCMDSDNIKTLRWFSDDYYNFETRQGTSYYNDLRFGSVWMDDLDKPDQQVFYFRLDENCDAHEIRETDNMGEIFKTLFLRLKGE